MVISRVIGGWRTVCTMMAPDWGAGEGVGWGAGAGAGEGCWRTMTGYDELTQALASSASSARVRTPTPVAPFG
jgi:hypothetical protein